MKISIHQKNKKNQRYSTCLIIMLVYMMIGTPICAIANELDMEYFTAHQIAKIHSLDKQLIDNANANLVDSVILNLIQHHKQGELIRQYYNNQDTKKSLQQSIQEVLLSTEFSSWLNAKIADAYVDRYSYTELKSIYQVDYIKNTSEFSLHLNEYTKEQNNIHLKQLENNTQIKKEFEDNVKLILKELPKTK